MADGLHQDALRLLDRVDTLVLGKRRAATLIFSAWLAGGHVLLDDVPGVAKTRLARTFARLTDLSFSRVQGTPDLLPQDITGGVVYDMKNGEFIFRPGPVFHHILLVDEINRTTPRSQAALLECMEERQVTADGQSFRVSFSGGVSEYKVDGAALRDLYQRADEALYVAKALGRERVLPSSGQRPEGHSDDSLVDVVVVEDDDVVAELLAHALSGGGYSSLRVRDGQAAVELLTGASRQPARLVLLDISLPGLDGFTVLAHLQREGVLEATRVIVLTARSSESEILRALEAGRCW